MGSHDPMLTNELWFYYSKTAYLSFSQQTCQRCYNLKTIQRQNTEDCENPVSTVCNVVKKCCCHKTAG